MSKYYINQTFYGIHDRDIIECKLIKYDEKQHMLYFRDASGQSYQCSEYKINREVFTLKFKAEQYLGIHKPKSNSYNPNPVTPESSATFSWSGSGIHIEHAEKGKPIMEEYLNKRALQNYKEDDK